MGHRGSFQGQGVNAADLVSKGIIEVLALVKFHSLGLAYRRHYMEMPSLSFVQEEKCRHYVYDGICGYTCYDSPEYPGYSVISSVDAEYRIVAYGGSTTQGTYIAQKIYEAIESTLSQNGYKTNGGMRMDGRISDRAFHFAKL